MNPRFLYLLFYVIRGGLLFFKTQKSFRQGTLSAVKPGCISLSGDQDIKVSGVEEVTGPGEEESVTMMASRSQSNFFIYQARG